MRHSIQPTIAHAAASPQDRGHDIELIVGVVSQVEAMQRKCDVEGFTRLIAPEAAWVTAFGRRLTGWPQIHAFTSSVLPMFAAGNEYAIYDAEHITFLADTVAAVNVRQQAVDANGALLEGRTEGRPLYVMRKQDNGWLIAVGQNTLFQQTEIATQQQNIEDRDGTPQGHGKTEPKPQDQGPFMTQRSIHHATFVIERSYKASPARVFEAFSDPTIKRRWFIDAEGWTTEAFSADFVEGGSERSRSRFGDGPLVSNETIYHEIVPGHRIVLSYTMTIGGKRVSVSSVSIEFTAEASGTRLVYTEHGAFLDGADKPADREAGWGELLDALAAQLERQAKR